MTGRPGEGVVRRSKDDYGETFTADLLEQYKLYVQSAESVTARRLTSIWLFLGFNTGLAALHGIQPAGFGQNWWAMAVSVLGIVVSLLWSRIVQSHKELKRVKFKLIREFEPHLPAEPYTCEWRPVEQGRGRARAVTTIEQWLPWMFFALHTVVLLLHTVPLIALAIELIA